MRVGVALLVWLVAGRADADTREPGFVALRVSPLDRQYLYSGRDSSGRGLRYELAGGLSIGHERAIGLVVSEWTEPRYIAMSPGAATYDYEIWEGNFETASALIETHLENMEGSLALGVARHHTVENYTARSIYDGSIAYGTDDLTRYGAILSAQGGVDYSIGQFGVEVLAELSAMQLTHGERGFLWAFWIGARWH